MSPQRKNKPDKSNNNPIHGYLPVFSPDFKADLAWWYRNETKKGDKILDLVADILAGDPLVYKVTGNKVYFLQARYHYQSG